jgi:hypothetical protein
VLDSNVEPCAGCFARTLGAPNSGREQSSKTPNNWQWNLSYQREIFKGTTWDIGYVGNKGYDLLTSAEIDEIAPGDRNHNGVDDRLEYARSTDPGGLGGQLRPFGSAFGDRQITFWQHTGHSSYNSMQTQVLTRWGASQFQASYTLSRTNANVPLDNSSGGLAADETRLDLSNLAVDDGLANTDRLHIFNAALVLALPTMEGQKGAKAAILGGWEIGTIFQASSGQALTVYTGSLGAGRGGPSGTGYNGVRRRLPGEQSREQGTDSRPCRLPDGRLPVGNDRQREARPVPRPGFLADRRRVLQDLPRLVEDAGAGAVRDLQLLQPDELPVAEPEYVVEPNELHAGSDANDHYVVHAGRQLRPGDAYARRPAGAVRVQDHLLKGRGSGLHALTS